MIYLFAKVGGEKGGPTVVRTLLLILSPPAPPLPARIKVLARLPKVFVVGHYTKKAEGRLQVARVILPIKIKCAEDFILLGIVHICFFGAESLALATKKRVFLVRVCTRAGTKLARRTRTFTNTSFN